MHPLASVVPVFGVGPDRVTLMPLTGVTPSSRRMRTPRLPCPPPVVPGGAATRLFWVIDGALPWPSQVTVDVASRLYERALEIVQADWAEESATQAELEATW